MFKGFKKLFNVLKDFFYFSFRGNPDKCDYQGRTALHHAVMNGHYNCLTYLVSWGCNIWAMDNDQHTALDLSLLHNKDEISRYLDGVQALQQTKNR